ncbi:MAG: type I polyketide synthase, partial [Candidatus Acidiferrales bacterium]
MPMETSSERFPNLSPLKKALLALEQMEARVAESERAQREPIAIVGMGCRFPQASNPAEFWRLLREGRDAVTEVPSKRWKLDDYFNPDPDAPGKMSTRWGSFLEDVDRFDPEFFGISPREARSMDPQQRFLLEVAWEALEDAGQGPRELLSSRTGVFVGVTSDDYSHQFYRSRDLSLFNAYFASGIARSIAGGRISYALGLQGPNISLDTACSSSLVTIHTACLYLRAKECRMALAGGASLILTPELNIAFSKARMMAPDGRCKTFDARADGYVRGEGCGMVVLKRLSDAVADGDRIRAVIRGSAVNQDGRSGGLTVPSGAAQEAVIRQALANGGWRAEEIGYVEAHGTGTALGDPIEAHALANVFGAGRTEPLVIGSVKTNLGHLESAAGVAGLIKVVLAMEHEQIPRHLHFEAMNPHIDWGELRVRMAGEGEEWKRGGKRRVAGVSSFGFSGTNAHVIVEEAPEREERKRGEERPVHILTASGRSEEALEEMKVRYEEALGESVEEAGDVCYTANAGRAGQSYRVAVVGKTKEELAGKLKEARGEQVKEREGARAVYLFPGQGAQYVGMSRELYETHAVYREKIGECGELLKGVWEERLEEVLWGRHTELLGQTAYTQPALFAVEYGLAELWRSWGIEPWAVAGHSVGEYVAACVAGVYELKVGIELIAQRARLMQKCAGQGGMLAVWASQREAEEALEGLEQRVSVAAVNGPESVVISGYVEELEEAERRLRAKGKRGKRLAVSHAFHSPQMDQMDREWRKVVGAVKCGPARVEWISTVTGKTVRADDLAGDYWARQVRQPVRFGEAMEALRSNEVFVEAGPGTTLAGLGRQRIGREGQLWATSVKEGRSDWEQMLESVGQLWTRGAKVNWAEFDRPYHRRRVSLPTYPFQRQNYWIDAKPVAG